MTIDLDVQLAGAGDVDAFERIYRRYHSRVYSLCLRMVRDNSLAEDLTQDVFIQLYRKLHTFRGESLIGTWLHKLTVNQVLMHLRKPHVWLERTASGATSTAQLPSGPENRNGMAVSDRISLNYAIDKLGLGYRMVSRV